MRNLFRSFERFEVDYLLISGQASILYGAATFSEDVDLWLRPARDNVRRFVKALAGCQTRIHKLTPPLEMRYLEAGHGFHFVVPSRPLPTYLDVMGMPPRVNGFAPARRRARIMETEWGRIPVVSIEDLVALKLTRRLSDYEVVSNLVQLRLKEEARPSPSLLRWAARYSFRAEDRAAILRALGQSPSVPGCRKAILAEIARLQARDARYWRVRIAELRRLRRTGALLVQGMPVSRLEAH